MSAVHKLPVEFNPPAANRNEPVVTLLSSDLSLAYLEDAEPSPLMGKLSNFWNGIIRTTKWLAVLALVGGYPAAVMNSHSINADPITLSQADGWADPHTGTLLTLLSRELSGPGWASDRAVWHPQARLNALPAWQEGLTLAASEFTRLRAEQTGTVTGIVDPDLLAASRLLAPATDVDAIPRLHAAAEALQTYEGRLNRETATLLTGSEPFFAELDLYTKWVSEDLAHLSNAARTVSGWPAAETDIAAIYRARAKAHVAAQLISASIELDPTLIVSREASEAREALQVSLHRMATFNPLIVTSQGSTHPLLSDHPAALAFYSQETLRALDTFKASLVTQPSPAITYAEVETGKS